MELGTIFQVAQGVSTAKPEKPLTPGSKLSAPAQCSHIDLEYKLKAMHVEDRCKYTWDNNKLCFCCLKAGHSKRQYCGMNIRCGKCGRHHNTGLRLDKQDPQLVTMKKCAQDSSDAMLMTAVAKVSTAKASLVRVFTDPGVQSSFVPPPPPPPACEKLGAGDGMRKETAGESFRLRDTTGALQILPADDFEHCAIIEVLVQPPFNMECFGRQHLVYSGGRNVRAGRQFGNPSRTPRNYRSANSTYAWATVCRAKEGNRSCFCVLFDKESATSAITLECVPQDCYH